MVFVLKWQLMLLFPYVQMVELLFFCVYFTKLIYSLCFKRDSLSRKKLSLMLQVRFYQLFICMWIRPALLNQLALLFRRWLHFLVYKSLTTNVIISIQLIKIVSQRGLCFSFPLCPRERFGWHSTVENCLQQT